MNLKYIIDIGSLLCGRTVEVEAYSAEKALEIGRQELNKDKFEKIIQVRNDRNEIVYNVWDSHGFSDNIREK